MKLTSGRPRVEHDRNITCPSVGPADAKVARVQALLHGMSLIMTHHSAPFEVVQSLREQLETYLTVDEEEKFLKRAKYIVLWPMSAYLKNEAPAEADQPFHFRGRFWRWARQRINCFSRKNTHLWYSFLQSKRAALPVTPDIVLSNFQKHRSQMETSDPLKGDSDEDMALLDEVLENLGPILRTLKKKLTNELTEFFRCPEKEIHKASESASLESSRSHGGQAGHIRQLLEVRGIREPEQLFKMKEHAGPTKGPAGVDYHQVSTTTARYGELEELQWILWHEIHGTLQVPIYSAKVEAVLEPFKVRTISKGESLPYYLAKRVQLVLHGAMRKMDCFRLIGRPLDVPDLVDIRRYTEEFMDSNQEWLSIDYSAATDGLSALLSSEIMKALLDGLYFENPQLYNMMLGVLAPHEVHYPEVAGVQLPPVLQKNGQLMGSVLSFPILCLANLGLYLTVRRRINEFAPMKQMLKSVLVNGDDMLYIGSKAEWELHKELGARIGLAMSPGKAYTHKRYANINSTSVDMDLASPNSTPVEVKFLNVGLMVGRHKVQGKVGSDDEDKEHPVVSVIDKVVEGALPGKAAEVFKRYCAMNSTELSKEAQGRNLFLSPQLGGFGVKPIVGIDTNVTAKQLSLALALLEKDPLLIPNEGVLPRGRFVEDLMNLSKDPIQKQKEAEEADIRYRVGLGPLPSWVLVPNWCRYLVRKEA